MRHRLCLFLFACGLALGLVLPVQTGQAQTQRPSSGPDALFRFERFSTVEGLTTVIATALLQDRQGFLWIATSDGLNRYDGYTFTHLLPGVSFWALAEDHEGLIWAGTVDQGLIRFDSDTGTPGSSPRPAITRFRHDPDDPNSLGSDGIRALHVNSAGTLWVGTTSGLDRFDYTTGTPGSSPPDQVRGRRGQAFTHFRHDPDDPHSLSIGQVLSLYEDREGLLWVGTATRDPFYRIDEEGGGLSRFDRATETFRRYQHDPSDPHSLIDDGVSHINEDRQGTLYVGTCQRGLHRYDRTRDRFERLMSDANNPMPLYAPQGRDLDGNCNQVTIIHEDALGGFWVGTYGGGLNYFDRDRGTVTHFENDPEDLQPRW